MNFFLLMSNALLFYSQVRTGTELNKRRVPSSSGKVGPRYSGDTISLSILYDHTVVIIM